MKFVCLRSLSYRWSNSGHRSRFFALKSESRSRYPTSMTLIIKVWSVVLGVQPSWRMQPLYTQDWISNFGSSIVLDTHMAGAAK